MRKKHGSTGAVIFNSSHFVVVTLPLLVKLAASRDAEARRDAEQMDADLSEVLDEERTTRARIAAARMEIQSAANRSQPAADPSTGGASEEQSDSASGIHWGRFREHLVAAGEAGRRPRPTRP